MKREKNTEAEVKKGGGVDWVSIDTMGGSTGKTHGDGVRGETPHCGFTLFDPRGAWSEGRADGSGGEPLWMGDVRCNRL